MPHPYCRFSSFVVFIVCSYLGPFVHADWSAWRGSAERSGSVDEQLETQLRLQWTRQLSELKPAWAEDPRLHFDAHYEPVVLGKTMFVASSYNDSVTAYDTETGGERWRFFADGPIRLAPVAHQGRLYFGSDDGCLYCLNTKQGTLLWKLRAAPSDRRAIGNERLISLWPVRGGPVIANNQLYFTVGVWPFEGTLLYSVDLDSEGNAPPSHSITPLRDVAPQGYLAVSGNRLFIPAGRANVHCLDLESKKPITLRYNAKGATDYHVAVSGKWMFHGGKIVDLDAQQTSPLGAHRPVADDGKVYFASKGSAQAFDIANLQEIEKKDRRGKTIKTKIPRRLWRLADEPISRIHLKAGQRLYGHHENSIVAIDLPKDDQPVAVSWKLAIEGTPATMVVSDGKLFVVTTDGSIHCFGVSDAPAKVYPSKPRPLEVADQKWSQKVAASLEKSNARGGYCLVLGIGGGNVIQELLRQSKLHVIALDPDASKVAALRTKLEAAGLYGRCADLHVGDIASYRLPPYFASLILSEDIKATGIQTNPKFAAQVFHALRPYGGSASFELDDAVHKRLEDSVSDGKLAKAQLRRDAQTSMLVREGALPGSADWTHEYGDPSNSLVSRDKLVKAPLGVLWFGGSASDNDLFYDRHQWGPSLAVIDGRMFLQGPEKLTAVDVYTGRRLWQIALPKGTSPGRRANWSPTGFHFVALHDSIYLAFPETCLRLDPTTGEQLAEFKLSAADDQWGRIRIWKRLMIVPVFRPVAGRKRRPVTLLAMDRFTGKIVWTHDNDQSFPMVAVGNDRVFCVEGLIDGLYRGASKIRKNGNPQAPISPSVKAYDVKTGEELWTRSMPRVPSWLAYSEEQDVLVATNKSGIDALNGRDGAELWKKEATGQGFRGHPENYYGRVILWKNRVIDQRGPGGAYELRTGKPIMRSHPITGQPIEWEFTKIGHHCNYAIASEHLLTFRAASAGFLDLASGGTGRLNGFRSGCRNSLIPANGVLNAPNMASGCVCSYSIFTSLALIHEPESNLWTYGTYKPVDGAIDRIGVNFGGGGDRRDAGGTLWLEYPSQDGPSPRVALKVKTENETWMRLHPSQLRGEGQSWISATSMRGVKTIAIPVSLGKGAVANPNRTYTARLFFAALGDSAEGQNVFDVSVQGRAILQDFDIVKAAGGSRVSFVHETRGISAADAIEFTFTARKGQASICGVEIIAEKE